MARYPITRFLTEPVVAKRWQIIGLVVIASIPFVGFLALIVVFWLNLDAYLYRLFGGK